MRNDVGSKNGQNGIPALKIAAVFSLNQTVEYTKRLWVRNRVGVGVTCFDVRSRISIRVRVLGQGTGV